MSPSGYARRTSPDALLGALLVIAGPSGGCGDPLRGADYLGESLFRVSGEVILPDLDTGEHVPDEDLRIALLWADADGGVEATVAVRVFFPARYQLDVYTPPFAETIHDTPGGTFSLGLLVLYRDADRDGNFTVAIDESYGGPENLVLLWAGEEIPLANDESFEEGFHAVRLDGSICQPVPSDMVEENPERVNLYVGLDDAYAALRDCAPTPGP